MVFARVPEELLGVEVSSRSLWAAKRRKFDSLAVWTLIELCLTLAWVNIEARSEPVGVHDSRLYDQAGHPTTHSSWCSSALAADAKSFRAPAILFAILQPADVEQARGNRSSDSQPDAIALHLKLPHSWGALFLFKISKLRFCTDKNIACYQNWTAITSLNN